MRRDDPNTVPVADEQTATVHPANVVRLFQDRIEDWGELAPRGVDDAENLRGCRPLRECIDKFGITLGKLASQFDIFAL